MDPQLTHFQTECEKRLIAALAREGQSVTGRCVDGVLQNYITGSIKGRDITFWIYADGADFKAGDRHRHFERPDYGSLDALAGKFTEELAEAAA